MYSACTSSRSVDRDGTTKGVTGAATVGRWACTRNSLQLENLSVNRASPEVCVANFVWHAIACLLKTYGRMAHDRVPSPETEGNPAPRPPQEPGSDRAVRSRPETSRRLSMTFPSGLVGKVGTHGLSGRIRRSLQAKEMEPSIKPQDYRRPSSRPPGTECNRDDVPFLKKRAVSPLARPGAPLGLGDPHEGPSSRSGTPTASLAERRGAAWSRYAEE